MAAQNSVILLQLSIVAKHMFKNHAKLVTQKGAQTRIGQPIEVNRLPHVRHAETFVLVTQYLNRPIFYFLE